MKIERHIVGHLTVPLGVIRNGESMEQPLRFPVPAYTVETDEHRILIDTGPHPAAMVDPDAHYGTPGAFGPFVPDAANVTSIAEAVDLSTVTMVVLTHMHFDHAGGLALVPEGVPVLVQRAEWQAGHDAAAIARNFFHPRDYAAREPDVRLIDGDHDLLGDGSITLLSTPGHTAGHQSVRIGDLIIAADVIHLAAALDDQRLPVFGDDLGAQLRSALRLRALRDDGATVIPGHDPELLVAGPVG